MVTDRHELTMGQVAREISPRSRSSGHAKRAVRWRRGLVEGQDLGEDQPLHVPLSQGEVVPPHDGAMTVAAAGNRQVHWFSRIPGTELRRKRHVPQPSGGRTDDDGGAILSTEGGNDGGLGDRWARA